MKFDDPNFSFENQQAERNRRSLLPPPLRRKKPGWKISGEDRKPAERWRTEYDQNGKICLLEECVPPPIPPNAPHKPSARSKFEIQITEACLCGGHHVAPGCKVICFGPSAGCLSGRGKILSEERNAF